MGDDTRTTVFINWLTRVMGPAYTADYIEGADTSRENFPSYYTRHDQDDDPKGHFTKRGRRRWML